MIETSYPSRTLPLTWSHPWTNSLTRLPQQNGFTAALKIMSNDLCSLKKKIGRFKRVKTAEWRNACPSNRFWSGQKMQTRPSLHPSLASEIRVNLHTSNIQQLLDFIIIIFFVNLPDFINASLNRLFLFKSLLYINRQKKSATSFHRDCNASIHNLKFKNIFKLMRKYYYLYHPRIDIN